MPQLTPEQIEEAKRRGVSQAAIDSFQRTGRVQGSSPQRRPALLAQIFSRDVENRDIGLFAGIARSTIGQTGATGLLSSIPRTALGTREASSLASQSEQNARLALLTSDLAERLKDLPEGNEKEELKRIIRENIQATQTRGANLSQRISETEAKLPTVREIAGQAVNTGLTAATFGGGLATKVPTTLAGKEFARAAGVRALQTGTISGGFTLGEQLQSDAEASEVIKNTALAFGTGVLLSVGASATRLGFSRAMTRDRALSLMKGVLRQKPKIRQAERTGVKPVLAEDMLKRGIKGSDKKILNTAVDGVANTEKALTGLAEKATREGIRIDVSKAGRALDRQIKVLEENIGPSAANSLRQLQGTFKKKGVMTVKEALEQKRLLYDIIGENGFNSPLADPAARSTAQGLRRIAAFINRELKKISPTMKNTIEEQAVYTRILDEFGVTASKNEAKASLFSIGDLIIASGGGIAASDAGVVAVRKSLENTRFRAWLANTMFKVSTGGAEFIPSHFIKQAPKGPVRDVARKIFGIIPEAGKGKVSRLAFMNAISQIFAQSRN